MITNQELLNQAIGEVKTFEIIDNGILIHTERHELRILFYSEEIARISAKSKECAFENHSYAVVQKPENISFQHSDNKEFILLKTNSIIVEIQKSSLRICFKDLQNRVLSEDDKDFGISWMGTEVCNYKKLQESERFIGLGEKTGPLDRKGNYYTNWNTDKFAYQSGDDPLYASIPFYIGLHNNVQYGIFFDNSYKSNFNFGAGNDRFSYFSAEGGEMNYFFIAGNTVADIVKNYSKLCGTTPLPPKWALGFQQCRYSYYPETEVKTLAQTFREKDIPCDVIYLDIHYMQDYRVFTWDNSRFPEPKKLSSDLKKDGFNLVLIYDPGVIVDSKDETYQEGIDNQHFVKYPNGDLYKGQVWPGWCHFPDFTQEKTRDWWGDKYSSFTDIGIQGFWNDMNEPAVWGKQLPSLVEFDFEGKKASLKKANNVYGMQMARSTYEGTKKLLNGNRPFVLTRAGYSGIQRFAALWTGDNSASDEHMLLGVRLVNSLGLSGVPFSGYDVGGFAGDPGISLYARWISIAAFSPFFRAHSMINSKDAEPWSFGEEVEEIARTYIKLRYRLMPYLYSLFYEASQIGMPICRSLAFDYSTDSRIFQHDNQYLFGPSILVCPVESYKAISKLFLPKGIWFELYNDKLWNGDQEILFETPVSKLPVFVKGSSFLVMQKSENYAHEKEITELEVHLYNGAEEAQFTVYEDDGQTYNFEKEQFSKFNLNFNPTKREVTIGKKEGKYSSKIESIKLYLHGFGESVSINLSGKTLNTQTENYSFIDQISNFDPWYKAHDESKIITNLPFVVLPYEKDDVTLMIG